MVSASPSVDPLGGTAITARGCAATLSQALSDEPSRVSRSYQYLLLLRPPFPMSPWPSRCQVIVGRETRVCSYLINERHRHRV